MCAHINVCMHISVCALMYVLMRVQVSVCIYVCACVWCLKLEGLSKDIFIGGLRIKVSWNGFQYQTTTGGGVHELSDQ